MGLTTLQIKLAIAAVTLIAVAIISSIAVHYHNSWVEAKEEISQLKERYSLLKTTAEACSNGVEELRKAADKKEEDAKKAMAKASASAKVNEEKGQTILISKPKSSDSCKAAVKLYQEYKATK